MALEYVSDLALQQFIRLALAEDQGMGDHTSLATVPADANGSMTCLCKEPGILAGLNLAERIYHQVDPKIKFRTKMRDGQPMKPGDEPFHVEGNDRALLLAERLVLNCMQRMSGIATMTRRLVELIDGTGATLLDTRKTTPNFRMCEKWAVVIGGGQNHRYALDDMILVKDNHIDLAGGMAQALDAVKGYLEKMETPVPVVVETRSLADVELVLEHPCPVERILLDNFTPVQLGEAVALIDGRCFSEASGGINEQTLRAVAQTGVTHISMGALTHSVRSLDLSLNVP